MGNLQIETPSSSTTSRKPIFSQENNTHIQGLSRSLSPYLMRTPHSRYLKSSLISKRSMNQSKIVTSRPNYTNRVYLNSMLIRSVVKDSDNNAEFSPDHISRPNNTHLKKSFVNVGESSRFVQYNVNKTSGRQSEIRKQRLTEKSFQEQSPRKQKILEESFRNSQINKQFYDVAVDQQKDADEKQYGLKDFTVSSIHKQHSSLSKMMKSENSSARTYGFDGHLRAQAQNCCCFHQCKQHSNPEKQFQRVNISDNSDTLRKRHVGILQQEQSFNDITIKNSAAVVPSSTRNETLNHEQFHRENREKCQEIIKRVRNFNQFLNEIKNRLKRQSEHSSFGRANDSQMPENYQNSMNTSVDNNQTSSKISDNSGKCSLKLALRLENQKIELEKYRKLVQRQLSKQHSIESIQIEQKNKDKIITVNYQQKNNKQRFAKKSTKTNEASVKSISSINKTVLKQSAIQPNLKQPEKKRDGQHQKMSKRVDKISKLLEKMQEINRIQSQQYAQINQIIHESDVDDR